MLSRELLEAGADVVATRFEDLKVWQQARVINKMIYEMTQQAQISRDFGLVSQLRRASVSSMNNIAEGFERFRRSEFLHYLAISKASPGEVRSMLYVALDVGYIDQPTFDGLYAQVEQLGRQIGSFRAGLAKSKPRPK